MECHEKFDSQSLGDGVSPRRFDPALHPHYASNGRRGRNHGHAHSNANVSCNPNRDAKASGNASPSGDTNADTSAGRGSVKASGNDGSDARTGTRPKARTSRSTGTAVLV
jgi:hypothetical protein